VAGLEVAMVVARAKAAGEGVAATKEVAAAVSACRLVPWADTAAVAGLGVAMVVVKAEAWVAATVPERAAAARARAEAARVAAEMSRAEAAREAATKEVVAAVSASWLVSLADTSAVAGSEVATARAEAAAEAEWLAATVVATGPFVLLVAREAAARVVAARGTD
jgi:hypothetical protein